MPTRLLILALLVSSGCGDDVAGECMTDGQCGLEICVDRRCVARQDAGAVRDIGPRRDVARTVDAAAPVTDTGSPLAGAGCSEDLRDVLDADGNNLRTCPPDQGCSDGLCIDACQAASMAGGTLGCGFRVPTPPMWESILPPCFAVFLANTWARDLDITVQRGGRELNPSTFARIVDGALPPSEWRPLPVTGLPVGEVAVLYLSSDPNAAASGGGAGGPLTCPITPAVDGSTEVRGPGLGEAFTVTTNAPVSAYDILPFGGASSFLPSASLLLPVSVWSEEYVVVTPPPGTGTPPGPLWIQVVSTVDGTVVEVRPTTDLIGAGTVPNIAAGETGTMELDTGEYAQWESGSQDPSGSLIRASVPVGVHAGNRFLRLQESISPGGDAQHQQMLPISALAHEYVAAPYTTRRADLEEEIIRYRLVGAYDGTILNFDPPIVGAPAMLGQSEVAEVNVAGPFVVTSQEDHPFAFAQVMSSGTMTGGSRSADTTFDIFDRTLGDEEMTLVFSSAQFLRHYVFFTDPTYGVTSLSLTRKRQEDGFADVTIDCLGVVAGWAPAGTSGEYEVVNVDLKRGGIAVGECSGSRHAASSEGTFGITVWGTDSYSSYAYPAGGNGRTLRDDPPLF